METLNDMESMSTDSINRRCQLDRLFIGVYPTGIAYADKWNEVDGDYKRLAFLRFATLALDIEHDCPTELESRIKSDAASVQAKQGEAFQISTVGQTVTLGYAL